MGRPRKPRPRGAFNNMEFSVMHNGPFVTLDEYTWRTLKRRLEAQGALIREILPNAEVAQRVYRSRTGPKSSNKSERNVTKR
jgi:hypothetical protein